jgi:S-(hydroxymethyl)glutathione dehydrogenase/alcohol dehydrogenase
MKAAVCYELGQPLQIEEIEIDPPQQGEVKVRVVATAVCHSDIHYIRGDWVADLPVVVGHEAAGIVEAVGENVTLARVGDPVIISLLRSCGHCFYCTSGLPNHCDGTFALRTESRLHTRQGDIIYQGIRTAAFADYVIVDQSQVIQVPSDMPLDRAALLACGVITGLGAVVNTAQVKPGSSVVVIGAGGVGLNAVQGAVLSGASRIIAIDLIDSKLEAAKIFGATHTLNARQEDISLQVRALTSGRGADYVLVTVGSTTAVLQGMKMLRRAGTLVIVGMPPAEATAPLSVISVADRGIRILGSFMGSTRLRIDIPWLVDLYQQGRLKLDELITARYPLEQINEAIEAMERGEALRNMIVW